MQTVVYIGTSLDGFIASKDGSFDWLVKYQNHEVVDSYNEFIKNIDCIVMGRGTYETVISFPEWPYDKKVFLLSNTIKKIPEALNEKIQLLALSPKEILEYLSNEGFSKVYVDGGKVIQGFLQADCIDEMIITRVPELIGKGIPLFGSLEKSLLFNHIKTIVLSNGLVKSYYQRVRE